MWIFRDKIVVNINLEANSGGTLIVNTDEIQKAVESAVKSALDKNEEALSLLKAISKNTENGK